MTSPIRPKTFLAIVLAAVLATLAFYFEYLPRFRRVHIPYDLAVYHFSLADYAFQSLKHGRWPQWDSTMYSGMSFAANVQSALFFPGTWLMFLFSWKNETLRYSALEMLDIAHVTVAFLAAFFWLRNKRLEPMAYTLGAAVYAFSGYLCNELQHLGLVVAFAWTPLALLGIDQASERNSFLPLWKVAAASALTFLGGYPPSWVVFALTVGVYALAGKNRIRVTLGTVLAVTFSLLLCAAQVLPAWEATHFRQPEQQYGTGIKELAYFISYLVPNYYDFGLDVPIQTNFFKEYLYLGAPGILGLAFLFRRKGLQGTGQGIAVCAACLVMATNPFDIVWQVIQHSDLLADILRSTYFLAGFAAGLTLLASLGLNRFLTRENPQPVPHWLVPVSLTSMAAWAVFEILRWPNKFAHGTAGIYDVAAMLAVFTLGLYVFRAQSGNTRLWIGLAILLSVGVDYKVFGTSKRMNADSGPQPRFSLDNYNGMTDEAFHELRAHPEGRVLLHDFAPFALETRHVGLATPQGFDPFLSTQYRDLVTRYGMWTTNRQSLIDPTKPDAMHLFGIRYILTAEQAPVYAVLRDSPQFRPVGSNKSYYKVYEYLDAQPPYSMSAGAAHATKWEPEDRVFTVESPGAQFRFSEQFYPGWSATIDGSPVTIEKWETAFQSVTVPAGKHTVEFRYREHLLPLGLAISLTSLAALGAWIAYALRATKASVPASAN